MNNLKNCELINLTPHNLNLVDKNNKTILELASQGSLRLNTEIQEIGSINGIMITKTIFKDIYFEPKGDIEIVCGEDELPEEKEDRYYIVSLPIAQYVKQKGRYDFLIPGEVVRSEDRRKILGMRSLAIL